MVLVVSSRSVGGWPLARQFLMVWGISLVRMRWMAAWAAVRLRFSPMGVLSELLASESSSSSSSSMGMGLVLRMRYMSAAACWSLSSMASSISSSSRAATSAWMSPLWWVPGGNRGRLSMRKVGAFVSWMKWSGIFDRIAS